MVSRDAVPTSSAAGILRATVSADRRRISTGERPLYHALTATSIDGSVDVTIRELPLIHLFVPDVSGALDGARLLVAQTLGVDSDAFDLRHGRSSAAR